MRTAFEELVYRSCLLLDEGDFAGYLALCAADFRYAIQAFSPEIRREMTWLEHDRAGMETLFRNLPRHHSDPNPLSRHATVYTVRLDEMAAEAQVTSALQVFRTALDGGETTLFAVGKLHDTARVVEGEARLVRRVVRLDTRQLGIGSHVPF
jgi:methanesulfonate monooxygenase small subunit